LQLVIIKQTKILIVPSSKFKALFYALKLHLGQALKHGKQYRGTDKSLARPGRKQARKHVRDKLDLNKIETRAVIKFLFLQGKTPKEIHAILTETLGCFLPGRAKDLSAPLYFCLLTTFRKFLDKIYK